MAAYFILDTEVQDPAGYAQYVKAGSPSVQQYGGKYIARAERRLRCLREIGSRTE